MEPERQETYERIPWETLEKHGGDRQWLVYAVAGAVAIGALAYSFMRNQPTAPPAEQAAVVATTVPAATSSVATTPSTVESPVVVSEADLYAVDPERLFDLAGSHAEWVALEYMAVDGSETSRDVLASLLPEGTPLPEAPDGAQVFVDWVRARSIAQTGPMAFDVEVLVRSLVSTEDGGFVRQSPVLVSIGIEVDGDGLASATGVPTVQSAPPPVANRVGLSQPPETVTAQVDGEVVGGIERSDGGWDLVVMSQGEDGVRRPTTVPVSP